LTVLALVLPASLSCVVANDPTDATLVSLGLNPGAMSPAFSGDHQSYVVTVPTGMSSFVLVATTSARVSTLGVIQDGGPYVSLKSGVVSPALSVPPIGTWSSVTVRVLAADGAATKEYSLLVKQAPSGGGVLAALTASAGTLSPAFDGATSSYSLSVRNGTGSVSLTPTTSDGTDVAVKQDQGAFVRVASGEATAPQVPAEGVPSTVIVRVTGPNGSTKDYTVALTQSAPGSFVVYAIGDSTMADVNTDASATQRGWGQLFAHLVGPDVMFVNAAKKGSSTKSFIADGSWEAVRSRLLPGDFVFIQFAQGDEVDHGLEGNGGVGTAPFGAYQVYLRRYVDQARAAGATPVLFTPVVRSTFSGAALPPSSCHDLTGVGAASIPPTQSLNYVDAMKQVGTARACAVVDLTAATKLLAEQLGPTGAPAVMFVATDDANLQPIGASLVATLAAEALLSQGVLMGHLSVSPVLVVNPSTLDFGTVSLGGTSNKPISVMGLSLSPDSGSVTVAAPTGFLVSATAAGTFGSSVKLAYTGTRLSPQTVYVRFAPTAAQTFSGAVTVAPASGAGWSVSVSGSGGQVATSVTETSAFYPLVADTSCSVVGLATCTEEAFSNLYVKNYQTPSLSSTTWTPWPPSTTITQRVIVFGDAWPYLETAPVPARYVEFAVSPSAGKTWKIDGLGLWAGTSESNSMAYRIEYSTQADFGGTTTLLDSPTNGNYAMMSRWFTPTITLNPGDTLRIRLFPWYKSSTESVKYVCLQGLSVHGWAQ